MVNCCSIKNNWWTHSKSLSYRRNLLISTLHVYPASLTLPSNLMSFQWTIKRRLELKMKIYFVYVFWLNSQLGQVREEVDGGGISSRDCRIAINFLLHTTTRKKKLQLSFPFFFSLSLSHVSTSSLLLAVAIFKMSPTICHCKFLFFFHMAVKEGKLSLI